jgi:hypothetical protein
MYHVTLIFETIKKISLEILNSLNGPILHIQGKSLLYSKRQFKNYERFCYFLQCLKTDDRIITQNKTQGFVSIRPESSFTRC